MSELIKKVFDCKALDVDTKTKQVKIAIAQVEDVDRDEDVFEPSAFDKTIKENGPKGTNEIWHLLDHTPRSFSALSKFKELGREGKYIVGVSHYKNSFAWREVAWPLYEAGDITQHSVGFEILKSGDRDKKNIRVINEVRLYEGSAVLWGAQPDTPTMQIVKSLMNLEDDSEITAAEKIEQLIKQIKKGRYEDDQSLLLVELKRLQSLFDTGNIKELFEKEIECPNCHKQTKNTEAGMGYIKCTHCESTFDNEGKLLTTQKTTEPEITSTLPDVEKSINLFSPTVQCPSCTRHTYDTQDQKGYIRCHRDSCGHVFVRGGTISAKI